MNERVRTIGGGGMVSPLRFSLRLSPCLRVACVVAHAIPCLACAAPGVPGWVRVPVLLAVCILAFINWRAYCHRALLSLELLPDGLACLVDANGVRAAITLLPDSTDLGWLVVLHWRVSNAERAVRYAMTPDAMSQECWRQVHVWLSWRSGLRACVHGADRPPA